MNAISPTIYLPDSNSSSPGIARIVAANIEALVEIIKTIAIAIFETIFSTVQFPTRYLGSKNWSLPGLVLRVPLVILSHLFQSGVKNTVSEDLFGKGYDRFTREHFKKEEIYPYLKYGAFTNTAHTCKDEWCLPYGYELIKPKQLLKDDPALQNQLEGHENCFFDPETSLKVVVHQSEKEVVIAFGALEAGKSEAQNDEEHAMRRDKMFSEAVKSLAGLNPIIYDRADQFFSQLKNNPSFNGKEIILTGLCLGGNLASYLALKYEFKAVCLNTMPMGVGLQEKLGVEKIQEADRYLTHIIVETDYLADTSTLVKVGDTLVNLAGIKTPGIFGKAKFIPTVYPGDSVKTHGHPMGSMLNFVGLDKRAPSSDVVNALGIELVS